MQRIEDYSMVTSPWKTEAERHASGAVGSGSAADAVRRRLHAVVIQRPLPPYGMPGTAMATGDAPPVSPTILA
jgi:hypothetical protein